MRLRQIQIKLYHLRFELLLASIISVFVLNIIFPVDIFPVEIQSFCFVFQFLAGINLFDTSKKYFSRIALLIGVLMITGRVLDIYNIMHVKSFISFIYICFFGLVMSEVFRQMYRAEVVNRKVVLAAVCGLLLIGYCGFFIFSTIEFFTPGSFRGIAEGDHGFNELFYYSYITIMTIGYGDITPVTWVAKNATVLVALLGYIYSLVVVAMIIGQFSSGRRR